MTIYFAPMEGITDGILRQTHNRIFGGVDVYCLPFHKLTQSMSLLTREERDISPEENEGLKILPQALTKDPDQLSAWLYYVSECGYSCADLNIGCPSPTVTKRGRGSGMLRDPGDLRTFFDRLFSNTLPVSLSVKTRIGYDSAEEWPVILSVLAGSIPERFIRRLSNWLCRGACRTRFITVISGRRRMWRKSSGAVPGRKAS